MAKISKIWAREILDSRATPTVEAACMLDSGHLAVSSVPSGASTGTHEVVELRDTDNKRYLGKGVLTAVANVNTTIAKAIIGMDPMDQVAIDKKLISLDGTENKSKIGANAVLAVSEVVAKVAAAAQGKSLFYWIQVLAQNAGIKIDQLRVPSPIFNMINGGLHGAGNLDFQEFHVIPSSSKTFSEGLQAGVEIYKVIGSNLARRGAIHSVGDEGGYAPNLYSNADALQVIVESIQQTNYALGRDVLLGLDVAASVFYENGSYNIRDRSSPMKDVDLLEYYKNLNDQYRLAILEDPFHEDAWQSWKNIYASLSNEVLIVGDDLLATSPARVEKAIREKACNAILVKPNQIGTVLETLQVIKMAKDASWRVVVSHRSGETNDWFIADFAVGVGADYVKFGAPARGERVAKYNRLSAVEMELEYSKTSAPKQ